MTDLHEEWSRAPDYREAYDRLGPEFELSRSLIEARTRSKLTQAEHAERMKTTQSVMARLESGRAYPLTRTLEKIARATGTRLRSSFDPRDDSLRERVPARRAFRPRTPGRVRAFRGGTHVGAVDAPDPVLSKMLASTGMSTHDVISGSFFWAFPRGAPKKRSKIPGGFMATVPGLWFSAPSCLLERVSSLRVSGVSPLLAKTTVTMARI